MIKAIETKYKGYRFRSRLEARWAVAFDAMGIEWTYEPEGYELPSGEWYLPDFRVKTKSGKRAWVEIKGGVKLSDHYRYVDGFDGEEKTKGFGDFVISKGGALFLLCDIPDPYIEEITPWGSDMFQYVGQKSCDPWENVCFLIKDKKPVYDIHVETSEMWGPRSEGCYILNGQKEKCELTKECYRLWWPTEAYEKARSARFEHGETGT